MDPNNVPTELFKALQLHDWYPVAALVTMIVLQVIRSNNIPYLTALWFKVPDGWRWLGPLLLGYATAFTNAFARGQAVGPALMAGVGGVIAIGFTAMGYHAAAKESPVHIDGGSGGRPVNPE